MPSARRPAHAYASHNAPSDIQPPVHVVAGATEGQTRLEDRDGGLNIPLDEMQVPEGPVRSDW
jgi:hypothetical protein